MATIDYYVDARNGNDSNDGLAWGTAVKTLAGFNIAQTAQGDFGASWDFCPVHCAGVFTERYDPISGRYNAFVADDFAVMDGQGTISYGIFDNNSYTHSYTGFQFKNHTTAGIKTGQRGTGKVYDCHFDEPYASHGCMLNTNGQDNAGLIQGCTFTNSAYGFYAGGNPTHSYGTDIYNCTFEGLTIGIHGGGASLGLGQHVKNCIFRNNTTHLQLIGTADTICHTGYGSSNGAWTLDYNCIDFSTGNCQEYVKNTAVTTYTDLASWQAVDTGANLPDVNSISQNPLFVDEATSLYGLSPTSPCLVNGSIAVGSLIQGAWDEYPIQGVSQIADSAVWTGAVFTDCELDGSNNLVLSAGQTTGTAVFDINFGGQREVKRFYMDFLSAWNTSVVSYSIGSLPDVWSFRVRTSPDNVPTWSAYSEVPYNTGGVNLNLSSVYHLGIELTLRNNA